MDRFINLSHRLAVVALLITATSLLFAVSGSAQTVGSLILSSTSGGNTNDDDLNVSFTLGSGATTAATVWQRNGSPMQTLFLPFEGGSTNALRDLSGIGSTVALTVGSPTWSAASGHDGFGAMTFASSDYLMAGNNTFPIHSSYTQTAWIYRTALGPLGYGFIIAGQSPYAQTHGLRVTSDNRVSAGQNNNYKIVQSYPNAINLNTWYFVGVTYDNSTGTMILYQDGQPVDTAIVPVNQRDVSDAGVMIGASQGGGNVFIGRIDDARVFNYVLSKEQMAALFTGTTNLVAAENSVGETWSARVTPFSSSAMGTTSISNSITIVATSPVITSTAITAGIAGKLYSYDVNATGGPAPTYSLTGFPAGMTINATAGLVQWTPASAGSYPVTVTATNSQGSTDQNFTIDVAAPTVGLADVALTAGGTNELTASYNLTLNATTAATAWFRNGSPIMALFMPMEGGATWSLDDASGNNITCVPMGSPTYTPTGGHDGNGCYDFHGNSYLIAGNMFPTGASYTKSAWIYHTSSGAFTHILSGWEHNPGIGGHGVRVTNDNRLSAGHNGNWRIVNTPAGTIVDNTWYFVAVTFDYAASSMQLFINGNRVDSQAVSIADRNVTDPSILVGSTQGAFCWPGRIDDARVYTYPLTRDQITAMYTATGGNRIAASEVQLGQTWQARVTPYSATEAGTMFASNSVVIGVNNPSPVLATIGPRSVNESQTLSFTVSASDPDLTIPALSASPLPTNATFFDNGNGTGSFSFTPDYSQAGPYIVTFAASDGNTSDTEPVTITVNNVNRPPVVASISPQMVLEGATLNLSVTASEPDAEALVMTASGIPANASFTDNGNNTGSFVFMPVVGQAGNYDVKFKATDPSDLADSITVTVTVVSTLPPAEWAATIHVEGEVAGTASHSADVIIGTGSADLTTPAAPYPPEYTTFAQLWKAGVEGPYYRDIRQSGGQCYYWVIEIDPHGNVAPSGTPRCAMISWNLAALSSSRHYSLVRGSGPGGTIVVADMRTTGSYQICDLQSSHYFTIQWFDDACNGIAFANLTLNAGWNLISLPVVPASSQVSQLFPTAEAVFGYNGSYQEATTLSSGSGYWIKVPSNTTVSVSGTPVSDVSQPLTAGWNLVGAPNCAVTPSTTPSGNIEAIFGFNGAYYPATDLTVGNGYWVKSTSNATMNASCAAPAPSGGSMPLAAAAAVTGIFTLHALGAQIDGACRADVVMGVDSRGQTLPEPPSMPQYSVALSIVSGTSQERLYKDVRSNSGEANSWTIAINPHGNTGNQLSGSATLSWNPAELGDARYELREGSGDNGILLVADMRNESSITVTGGNEEQFYTVSRTATGSLPSGFALDQNYPNPFNPSTQIGYNLPQSGNVRLEIFNVLGQQVKTLLDNSVEAGHHVVTWDATDNSGRAVASGIYFYRLTSDGFVNRKKMLLLR